MTGGDLETDNNRYTCSSGHYKMDRGKFCQFSTTNSERLVKAIVNESFGPTPGCLNMDN